MSPMPKLRLIGAVLLLEGIGAFALLLLGLPVLFSISAFVPFLPIIISAVCLVVPLLHLIVGVMCLAATPTAWPAVIVVNSFKLFCFSLLLLLSPVLLLLWLVTNLVAIVNGELAFLALNILVIALIAYYVWIIRSTNFIAGPDGPIRDAEADPFGRNLLTTDCFRRSFLLAGFLTRRAGAAIYALPLLSSNRATSFRLNREDGIELVRVARRMTYVSGSELLRHDPRPPVTYLRNFFNDGREVDRAELTQSYSRVRFFSELAANPLMAIVGFLLRRVGGGVKERHSGLNLTRLNLGDAAPPANKIEMALSEEELLGSIFNLKGPFIAIGNPKEQQGEVRDYGASRIYAEPGDHDWREKVRWMLNHSSLIIFKIDPEIEGWGFDPGWEIERADLINLTWWEIITAAENVPLDKLIFYLPLHRYKRHRRDYYESIRRVMSRHTTINFPRRLGNNRFIELDVQGDGRGVSVLALLRRHYLARKDGAVRHNPYLFFEWLLVQIQNSFTQLRNAASWSAIILSLIFVIIKLADAMAPPSHGFQPPRQSGGPSIGEQLIVLLAIQIILTFYLWLARMVIAGLKFFVRAVTARL